LYFIPNKKTPQVKAVEKKEGGTNVALFQRRVALVANRQAACATAREVLA